MRWWHLDDSLSSWSSDDSQSSWHTYLPLQLTANTLQHAFVTFSWLIEVVKFRWHIEFVIFTWLIQSVTRVKGLDAFVKFRWLIEFMKFGSVTEFVTHVRATATHCNSTQHAFVTSDHSLSSWDLDNSLSSWHTYLPVKQHSQTKRAWTPWPIRHTRGRQRRVTGCCIARCNFFILGARGWQRRKFGKEELVQILKRQFINFFVHKISRERDLVARRLLRLCMALLGRYWALLWICRALL